MHDIIEPRPGAAAGPSAGNRAAADATAGDARTRDATAADTRAADTAAGRAPGGRPPGVGDRVLGGRYQVAGPPLSDGAFDVLLPGRPAAPEDPDGPPRHLVLLFSREPRSPGARTGTEAQAERDPGAEAGADGRRAASGADGADAALRYRRQWEAELRTRREVAAVPGADRSLLLHEATGAADGSAGGPGPGGGRTGDGRTGGGRTGQPGTGPRDGYRPVDGRITAFPVPGPPSTLAAALARRRAHAWLSSAPAHRLGLWQLLARIAEGIQILHDHRVCHRAIGPEAVLLSPAHGPDSARLGGLEWSLRLRNPGPARATPTGLHTAPEAAGGGAPPVGFAADWFAFGVLAARCLLPVDARWAGRDDPADRHRRLLAMLARGRGTTPLERDVLARLVAADPERRLTDGASVREAVRDAARDAELLLGRTGSTRTGAPTAPYRPTGTIPAAGRAGKTTQRPVTVVFDPRSRQLVEQCLRRGLAERLPLGTGTSFDARRPEHRKALQKFLTDGFRSGGAQLTPLERPGQWVLSGDSLHLLVTRRRVAPAASAATGGEQGRDGPARSGSVPGGGAGPDDAPIVCLTALSYLLTRPGRPAEQVTGRIRFLAVEDYRRLRKTRATVTSRRLALPPRAAAAGLPRRHEELLDHLRMTNQFELLLLDAELFRCEIAEVHLNAAGRPALLRISELPRVRPPLSVLGAGTDMIDWLARRRNRDSTASPVHLCPPDPETIARRAPSAEWEIADVDTVGRTALLRPVRPVHHALQPGTIRVVRPADLHGQLAQVRRRQWAINMLTGNPSLLDALTGTGTITGNAPGGRAELPLPLPQSLPLPLPDTVADEGKRRQIAAILDSDALYTLQGPPGTGKTHTVAWLLREMLELDDSSRILVTAQAHPAVDVLRNKAEQEALRGTGDTRSALTVRLRGNRRKAATGEPASGTTAGAAPAAGAWAVAGEAGAVAGGTTAAVPAPPPVGSEERLVAEVLADTLARLERRAGEHPGLSGTALAWLRLCRSLQARGPATDDDFAALVRRAVAIVYTTAADRNLVALARAGERFDWVVVEEAGKAHGFELALPLSLGHRWLMIGDPAQLPAYRMDEYQKIPAALEDAMEILGELRKGRRLTDERLLRSWDTWSTQRRAEFADRVETQLPLFGLLHDRYGPGEPDTGLLTGQYRMHPAIGELVSATFYGGRLQHRTADAVSGGPLPSVRHGLTAPAPVRDHAVVWLDLPWAAVDPAAAECDTPRYGNPAEVLAVERFLRTLRTSDGQPLELAVLAPYRRQVTLLRERFAAASLLTALTEAGIGVAPDPLLGPRDDAGGPPGTGTGATPAESPGGTAPPPAAPLPAKPSPAQPAATGRAAAVLSAVPAAAGPSVADAATQGVFTVDSFQGNQAQVVVVSLVRNNAAEPGEGLGFLANPARLNVLVSRAESLLVLTGSWAFLRHQLAEVSRDPEDADPLRYAAAFADTLAEWFASGHAVRIPADLTGLARPPAGHGYPDDLYAVADDAYPDDDEDADDQDGDEDTYGDDGDDDGYPDAEDEDTYAYDAYVEDTAYPEDPEDGAAYGDTDAHASDAHASDVRADAGGPYAPEDPDGTAPDTDGRTGASEQPC
ncbi:AAA domain-containing protein [Streptomyces parvus]|uniref:AAA domain-containing protein n=1 Tax=Streptomyces parvus TaxID=66428 RepID=UPI003720A996